jgi:putative transcriptional regulator
MGMTPDDPFAALAPAYALGALDADEAALFVEHLASGCAGCAEEVEAHGAALGALAPAGEPPDAIVREQLLDLADAPRGPIDTSRYSWDVVAPGVRVATLKEDPSRDLRACLVWADPGARHPAHRHRGDEVILVLQGALRDERREYGPGSVCRSRPGSVHSEEAMPGETCFCYVVYYGALEML